MSFRRRRFALAAFGAGSISVGPPTFTNRAMTAGSLVGGVTMHMAVTGAGSAGTPSATRFISVLFTQANGNNDTVTTAVFNATGTPIAATVVHLASTADANTNDWWEAHAVVPADLTGGGISLDVTLNGTVFGSPVFAMYSSDSATMNSQTPVLGYATSSSASSLTTTAAMASGAAVLAFGGGVFGINTFTYPSPNDPAVSSDGNFGAISAAHANNSSVFATGRVTLSFSGGPAAVSQGLVVYR